MRYRCIPIDTATAERFRASEVDDNGNRIIRRVATGSGEPCRHCLRTAAAGEELLLLSWNLPRPRSVYWTPSPIFLHAEACPAFDEADAIAPILRNSLVSVRAYDAEDMVLYDLGQVADGAAIEGPLEAALADPRTKFVNVHTARPGCILCAVEKVQ